MIAGLAGALCLPLPAQNHSPSQRPPKPSSRDLPADAILPMPADRAEDSYAIYSMLMPGKTLASLPSAQGAAWAIADVTLNESDRNPRIPPDGQLKPPSDNPRGFREAVGDYEANRFARVQLDRHAFHLGHSFVLVNSKTARTGGYPGVTYFSEVYFDRKHEAALVYMYEWCAELCSSGTWVYLEKRDRRWTRQSGLVVPGA